MPSPQLPVTGKCDFWTKLLTEAAFNTRYLQQTLVEHQAAEGPSEASDVASLSPLFNEHVSMLGRYDFTLSERVAAGELRPLCTLPD